MQSDNLHPPSPSAIGLRYSGYYLPGSMSVDALADATGMPEERRSLYSGPHGLRVVHVAGRETPGDMAEQAVRSIFQKHDLDPLSIDTVILYHTMNFLSLEPRSLVKDLQRRLRLERATGLAISGQHCASPVTALRTARNMILAKSARTVLLVGCDGFLGSLRREIIDVSLQGEGASCAIVQSGCEDNRVLAVSTQVDGAFYKGIVVNQQERERFDLLYYITSHRLIKRTLERLSLTMNDIRLIIPHNINRSSWRTILASIKCPDEKLFSDNIGRCGHVCSSDLFINLTDAIQAGRLRKGDHYLLFTVGLGAVWGCAILRH